MCEVLLVSKWSVLDSELFEPVEGRSYVVDEGRRALPKVLENVMIKLTSHGSQFTHE